MPEPIQSCSRRSISGAPPQTTFSDGRTTTTTTTSIYNTHLGPTSFTWSATFLSLSLQISLPTLNLSFNIRPRIFLKAKGSKHLSRSIVVAWDLTRATFHLSGGPEPRSRFYVAITISGEMLVVAGDMVEEAHRKMRVRRGTPAMLVSRKDRVSMRSGSYRTAVIVSGKERGIFVEIGGKGKESVGLVVGVDGMKVLEVRRIGWKFRGREKVEIGGRIQISWNLCGWLFPAKDKELGGDDGGAVFVFVFEGGEGEGKEEVVFGGEEEEFGSGRKSLLKTRSSSFSSSASSTGSSSVMDWASPEEEELRGGGGFTLVVHAWRS